MARQTKTLKAAHRGRFQAQGQNLEASEAWAVPIPPSKEEGEAMLQNLESKLERVDAEKRQAAFNDARSYIQTAYNAGGVYAPINKTFMVRNTRKERVDLEINGGSAFKVVRNA
ncbi:MULTISPECIES: hypothetical protein [Enterobacteriaceae]|uniref:hypothetical protein n=1 Tax=Enterobacteriaceae TaxID=543 RepID=UPI002B2BFFEC|nr:hypothetical protein R0Q77_27855 [Citrobacter braakii]